MGNTKKIVISIGTNLGNRKSNLEKAIKFIEQKCDIIQVSNIYQTEPWGYSSVNYFLNMGVVLKCYDSPEKLLQFLKSIEVKMGRDIHDKDIGYQDRIIDLDILLFGNQIVSQTNLIIPHPKIIHRKFSLLILKDLFKDEIIPIFNKTPSSMLIETTDNSDVCVFR